MIFNKNEISLNKRSKSDVIGITGCETHSTIVTDHIQTLIIPISKSDDPTPESGKDNICTLKPEFETIELCSYNFNISWRILAVAVSFVQAMELLTIYWILLGYYDTSYPDTLTTNTRARLELEFKIIFIFCVICIIFIITAGLAINSYAQWKKLVCKLYYCYFILASFVNSFEIFQLIMAVINSECDTNCSSMKSNSNTFGDVNYTPANPFICSFTCNLNSSVLRVLIVTKMALDYWFCLCLSGYSPQSTKAIVKMVLFLSFLTFLYDILSFFELFVVNTFGVF